MKTFKLILLSLAFLLSASSLLLCQGPPYEDPEAWTFRDTYTWSGDIPPVKYSPPCSCNCSEMLKPAKLTTGQTNDEEYLIGGYQPSSTSDLFCQKMELNLSACNGYEISSISIQFNSYTSNCFNNDIQCYYEDEQGNMQYDKSINLSNPGNIGVLTINPPIAPCESRKVVFYLCSSCFDFSGLQSANASFTVGGNCIRNMKLWFDFLLSSPGVINQNSIDFEYKLGDAANIVLHEKKTGGQFTYKVVNLLNETVHSGALDSMDEVRSKISDLKLTSGLYIFQVLEDGKIVKQEKLTIAK